MKNSFIEEKIFPDIKQKYFNNVPADFVNDLQGWSFSKDRVLSEKGKLLALDIDLGESCHLNCPMCFRKDGNMDLQKYNDIPQLNLEEIINILKQGKNLGLESVRILGAGEPLENIQLLTLIKETKNIGIKDFVIFTQSDILGNDELFSRIHSNIAPQEMIKNFLDLNVSLMIRYDSFYSSIQDKSTGTKNVKMYKDIALKRLVDVGFNSTNPTRIGIVAPITRYTYDGLDEIYSFFRLRNIYPLIPFIACAGRSANIDGKIKDDVSFDEKVTLLKKIYTTNLQLKIPFEDISAYPGTHICTFLSTGMYITSRGRAYVCEGNDEEKYVIGDIREKSLKELWENSVNNLQFSGKYNYGCPPKYGLSIPKGLFKKVKDELKL